MDVHAVVLANIQRKLPNRFKEGQSFDNRLDIVSTSDRIVPAASAAGAGERLELAAGHVGMMIGGRAEEMLWRPLAGWLSRIAAR